MFWFFFPLETTKTLDPKNGPSTQHSLYRLNYLNSEIGAKKTDARIDQRKKVLFSKSTDPNDFFNQRKK